MEPRKGQCKGKELGSEPGQERRRWGQLEQGPGSAWKPYQRHMLSEGGAPHDLLLVGHLPRRRTQQSPDRSVPSCFTGSRPFRDNFSVLIPGCVSVRVHTRVCVFNRKSEISVNFNLVCQSSSFYIDSSDNVFILKSKLDIFSPQNFSELFFDEIMKKWFYIF